MKMALITNANTNGILSPVNDCLVPEPRRPGADLVRIYLQRCSSVKRRQNLGSADSVILAFFSPPAFRCLEGARRDLEGSGGRETHQNVLAHSRIPQHVLRAVQNDAAAVGSAQILPRNPSRTACAQPPHPHETTDKQDTLDLRIQRAALERCDHPARSRPRPVWSILARTPAASLWPAISARSG